MDEKQKAAVYELGSQQALENAGLIKAAQAWRGTQHIEGYSRGPEGELIKDPVRKPEPAPKPKPEPTRKPAIPSTMKKKSAAFDLGTQHAVEDQLKLGIDYSAEAGKTSPYTKQIEQQGAWTRGGAATASPTPQSQTAEQPGTTKPLRESAVAQTATPAPAPPANQTMAQQMQRGLRSQAMAGGNRFAKGWYGWGGSGR